MAVDPRETERLLYEAFQPAQLAAEDDNAKHIGHAGTASGDGRYDIEVVSTAFVGKDHLARHRMVHDALHALWPAAIHVLMIRTATPEENT